MRTFLSISVLMAVALPVLADGLVNPLPEPESLALLAIAAVAMLAVRRRK